MTRSAYPVRIEPVTADDMAELLRLLRAFAEYERLSHLVTATESDLRALLVGERRAADAIIARSGHDAIGFAVFHPMLSTFAGRAGMYLEDIYVEPRWRGCGVGRRLIACVARIAHERGCDRMNWSVLDWNEPALGFYRRLGAEPVTDWVGYRIGGEAFARLVAGSDD